MMLCVIVIETGLALDAKVTTSHEAREGIAPVIVFSHFDEDELFILGWSLENDLVVVIHMIHGNILGSRPPHTKSFFGHLSCSILIFLNSTSHARSSKHIDMLARVCGLV